jgi:hypothetical protein
VGNGTQETVKTFVFYNNIIFIYCLQNKFFSFKKKGTTTKLEKYLIVFGVVILAVCVVFVVLFINERKESNQSGGESPVVFSGKVYPM